MHSQLFRTIRDQRSYATFIKSIRNSSGFISLLCLGLDDIIILESKFHETTRLWKVTVIHIDAVVYISVGWLVVDIRDFHKQQFPESFDSTKIISS